MNKTIHTDEEKSNTIMNKKITTKNLKTKQNQIQDTNAQENEITREFQLNINKFSKPRIRVPNTFISAPLTDVEITRDMCNMIDKEHHSPEETEYYKSVIEFTQNKGKTKIQLRNQRADIKKKQQQRELSNI